MIVPSPPFLAFAFVAALVFNLIRPAGARRIVLLAANLAFIASFTHNPVKLLPFAGFLALGYAGYRVTRNGRRPRGFVALLLLIVFVFFWLKRYSFLPAAGFLHFPYLLVGLSYVFFRVLHLVIDGHQEAIEHPIDGLSYLNYTLNFTALVSGPIQRYQDYRASEVAPPPLTMTAAGQAIERIVLGYFKVAIVSALLAMLQHRAIAALPLDAGLLPRLRDGLLIMSVYPVYLYFNFSGYVDVAIGVARFFAVTLPENFDRPFSSTNFIGFWNRWHMTLSGWLKTYVYNPLMMTGMKHVTSPSWAPYLGVGAFFITFFLVGLWHGQTSEFLFFGVLQGGGVSANKLYQLLMTKRLGRTGYRNLCADRAYIVLSRGLTFTWFAFTLLWFWSRWAQIDGFADALGAVGCLLVCAACIGLSAAVLAMPDLLQKRPARLAWRHSRYLRTVSSTALVVVIIGVSVLLAAPAPDIVYKSF